MKKILLTLGLLTLVASCGSSNNSNANNQNKTSQSENAKKVEFKKEWISDKKPIQDQTYKVAVVNPAPFKGILNPILYQDGTDSYFLAPLLGDFIYINDDFQLVEGGMATLKINSKNNTYTYLLRPNLKWSDGKPLTVDDIIFTYKVLASPKYTGVRYNASEFNKIIGMKEYHEGKTKNIKGLQKISDTELVVHVSELSPGLITGGSNAITDIIPKHYLENENIATLEGNPKIRLKPLSYGPFMIKQILPGESIEYVPNPYYWNEANKPEVKSMIMRILQPSTTVASMKNGEYDLYQDVSSDVYDEIKNLDNIALLGKPALYYSYIGFNMGKWSDSKQTGVVNPNSKTGDIRLRHAMTYALNRDLINKVFYKGIRVTANGVVPPVFKNYYDKNIGQFPYDPKKANELLDEAGYKYKMENGKKSEYRMDKNGKPFVLYLGVPNFGEIAEPLAQAFIQNWKSVGLDVELTDGRLLDAASFFDLVQKNSNKIDIWSAAWGVGSSLDISNLYSIKSRFNWTRYSTPENEKLIKELNNKEFILHPELRVEAFKKWHKNYIDTVYGFAPLSFKYELIPVNKRVKKYTIYTGSKENEYNLQLTATAPLN